MLLIKSSNAMTKLKMFSLTNKSESEQSPTPPNAKTGLFKTWTAFLACSTPEMNLIRYISA